MRVVGIKFSNITAEKFKDLEGNIQLKSAFDLAEVDNDEKLSKLNTLPILSFSFTYSLNYEKTAKISFSGKVYIELDDKLASEIIEDKNKISNDLRKLVLDYVLIKTHVESLHLEEKLGLPFHIKSPSVSIEESKNKK